jgi:hypothetical protein
MRFLLIAALLVLTVQDGKAATEAQKTGTQEQSKSRTAMAADSNPQHPQSAAEETQHETEPTNKIYTVKVLSQAPDNWYVAYVVITALIAFANLGTLIAIWMQRNVMRKQLDAMGEMKKQTALLQQQVELTTRAWLSAEMISAGPVIFDQTGGRVNFAVRLINMGHSPATNVNIHYKVINSQSPPITPIQKELAAISAGLTKDDSWGLSIFPQTQITQNVSQTVEKTELVKYFQGFPKDSLLLHVIGCVDYGIGSSSDRHQTFFAYSLFGIGDDGKTVTLINGTDSHDVRFVHGGPIGSGAN